MKPEPDPKPSIVWAIVLSVLFVIVIVGVIIAGDDPGRIAETTAASIAL